MLPSFESFLLAAAGCKSQVFRCQLTLAAAGHRIHCSLVTFPWPPQGQLILSALHGPTWWSLAVGGAEVGGLAGVYLGRRRALWSAQEGGLVVYIQECGHSRAATKGEKLHFV